MSWLVLFNSPSSLSFMVVSSSGNLDSGRTSLLGAFFFKNTNKAVCCFYFHLETSIQFTFRVILILARIMEALSSLLMGFTVYFLVYYVIFYIASYFQYQFEVAILWLSLSTRIKYYYKEWVIKFIRPPSTDIT
jgi:hypothetical protein